MTMPELRGQLRRGARPVPAPWRPPRESEFSPATAVLAFDASLTNVGWILIERLVGFTVHAKGTIRSSTERTGYLETWDKAWQVREGLQNLAAELSRSSYVAIEAPSVGGGHRTESSLIAGFEAWAWARLFRPVTVVSAQHVASILCGNGRLPSDERKAAVRAAVAGYIPTAGSRKFNEHERDAAGVALTYLYDRANSAEKETGAHYD